MDRKQRFYRSFKGSDPKHAVEVMEEEESYNGPIIIPKGPSGVLHDVFNKSLTGTLSSNGSGVVIQNFSSADVVSLTGWTNLIAQWKEYRVLAMKVTFIPIAASTSTPLCVAVVKDHNSTLSTLTSMDQAAAYDAVKFITSGSGALITNGRYPSVEIRASGVEELGFIDRASSPTTQIFGIKTYSTTGTNSVVYFECVTTFTVEVRGSSNS